MNFTIYLTENKTIPIYPVLYLWYITDFFPVCYIAFCYCFYILSRAYSVQLYKEHLQEYLLIIELYTMITTLISYNFMSLEKTNVTE